MTSCKTIVGLALSKIGVSGGVKPARQADLDLGLITLQSLLRALISGGTLGRARPVTIDGGIYTARENDRIQRLAGMGTVIRPDTITEELADLHTCGSVEFYDYPVCAPPRPPRDGAFVIINDTSTGNTEEWIYEGYTNRWISLHDLSLDESGEVRDDQGHIIAVKADSVCPLAARDANGLAALLATKLADHFGQTPSPLTLRDAQAFLASLANRFGEPETHLCDDLFF